MYDTILNFLLFFICMKRIQLMLSGKYVEFTVAYFTSFPEW